MTTRTGRRRRIDCALEGLEARTLLANITGVIWHDLDGDAARDAGEPGLSGWGVYIDANRNGKFEIGERQATSGADGTYIFANVPVGYHLIGQIPRAGWRQTFPSATALPTPAPGTVGIDDVIAGAIKRAQDADVTSRRWVVGLADVSLREVIAQTGATATAAPALEKAYVLDFPTDTGAEAFAGNDGLAFYYPLVARQQSGRLIPNDPMFSQQWHLNNTGQTGGNANGDLNVTPVWDAHQGEGVVVAVVDDGLQYTHPDLSANYSAINSFDFNNNDSDPMPSSADAHGTVVAGIIGARGGNGTGVSGVAPKATLAGIRLTAFTSDDEMEALALSYRRNFISVYSNSWGPDDDGETLEGPGAQTLAALRDGALLGRGGKGNVFVWSAGNGAEEDDNVNYDGYANSRYVIAVGALTDFDVAADYTEVGAPVLVTAFGDGGNASITSTDLVGSAGYSGNDYTAGFGGTSASAPMVAGVVALMLQANPNLGWRDVQQILARSARRVDPAHPDWSQNGAGLWVNHTYGYGAVNAAAAVALAKSWENLGTELQVSSATINVNQTIPDGVSTPRTSSVMINNLMLVDSVEVVFDADHTFRGDLKVVLVSPEGTESVLAAVHDDSGNNYRQWTFSSKRHIGEIARGNWTLRVTDESAGVTGRWNTWKLNVYGTAITTQQFANATNATMTVSGRDFGDRPLPGPKVSSAVFRHDLSPNRVVFTFDRDVASTISVDDLELKNVTTNQTITTANAPFVYDSGARRATWTLAGVLADGNYTVRLKAAGISAAGGMLDGDGNGAGGDDYVTSFFQLSGDVTRDRIVNHLDFNVLFANFGRSGQDADDGDLNFDGRVDFADFQRLERLFGRTMAVAPVTPAPALPSTVVKPAVVAKGLFSTKPVTRKQSVLE